MDIQNVNCNYIGTTQALISGKISCCTLQNFKYYNWIKTDLKCYRIFSVSWYIFK